jgi:predicted NAD-dependent protein-ADP-ribosyltransferase YbiA (DUF1768 family)
MDLALWHKFTQHESLKKELLATDDAELVEVCLILPCATDQLLTNV